jgi:hypothetical protein
MVGKAWAIEGTTFGEISRVQRSWDAAQTAEYIAGLPLWNGDVDVQQHFGGPQNRTYFATTPDGQKYAGRTGFDQFRTRPDECRAVHDRMKMLHEGAWAIQETIRGLRGGAGRAVRSNAAATSSRADLQSCHGRIALPRRP